MKMKLISGFFILVLVACGKVEISGKSSVGTVGELKSISPITADANALLSMTQICQAIEQKTGSLNLMVNSAFTFSFESKDCSATAASAAVDVATTLQSSAQGFKFVQAGGSFFYFSEPETTSVGLLAPICEQIKSQGSFTSPLASGSEFLFIDLGFSQECSAGTLEKCVKIEKGSLDSNEQAKIHTKEWLKVDLKTGQPKFGFVNFRKQITGIGCGAGQVKLNQATLK